MLIQARAKINWSLDIVGQRAGVYHLMDMLMRPAILNDVVTVENAEGVTLTTGGSPLLPPSEKHLALRAALRRLPFQLKEVAAATSLTR